MRELAGVCGVLSTDERPAESHLLDTMVAPVQHRVSGGMGRYDKAGVTLGQLYRGAEPESAPDIPTGPWVDPCTGTVVAADARIDNGSQLRKSLGNAAPPPNAGDLALIGCAYRRWGLDCLPRLIGDFAVAIWDPSRRRLALARDPMAMRALYYRAEENRVLLATEVKQILAAPGVPAEPDERMVACYLSGCFGDPEWTYYQGISQVAPAHVTVFRDGSARSVRFWDVDPTREIRYRREEDYAAHLRELFVEATRARLPLDRPSGVFLSGGVDSGAVASAAGWLLAEEGKPVPFHSYSWAFETLPECDERHLSDIIVDHYDFVGRDIPADDAGPLSEFEEHAPDRDDPFHSHFHTLVGRGLEAASADGVRSLFTGIRGDLAIGPLDTSYASLLSERRLRALLEELQEHARYSGESVALLAVRHLWPTIRPHLSPSQLVRRTGRSFSTRSFGEHWDRPPPHYPSWIHPSLARRVDLAGLLETYGDVPTPSLRGPLRERRYQWIFMPMHLRWAVVQERMAARAGMQAVDAWSDRRIAEFAVAIPQHVARLAYNPQKDLARNALRGIMPDQFRVNAEKTVPTPLFNQALRREANSTVQKLLIGSRGQAKGWLDTGALSDVFESIGTGGAVNGAVWWALSLEWWARSLDVPPRRS